MHTQYNLVCIVDVSLTIRTCSLSRCGKCRQIGPFLDELAAKYPGVKMAKV